MATAVVYDSSPTGKRCVIGDSADYATARETGTTVEPSGTYIGNEKVGNYYCSEAFYQFDTSVIGAGATVTDVVLELDGGVDQTGANDFIVEARPYDWGGTLAVADFVAGSALAALTLLASWNTTGYAAGYNAFTSEAAFPAAIDVTGWTRLVLNASTHRLGTTPTATSDIVFTDPGSATEPKLTITYTTATPQTVLPDADTTTTGWATTPLWSKVDDDPASPDGTTITATAA